MEKSTQPHFPDKHSLFLIIDVVIKNASIRKVRRHGLNYNQIFMLTKYALQNGYIKNKRGKLVITRKGKKYHSSNQEEFRIKNKDEWIDFDKESKVAKISKTAIFVPKQDELTFLL